MTGGEMNSSRLQYTDNTNVTDKKSGDDHNGTAVDTWYGH